MSKVKVTCEIERYSDSLEYKQMPTIRINSHWNRSNLVELEINSHKVLVDGNNLITAVKNCMNTGF